MPDRDFDRLTPDDLERKRAEASEDERAKKVPDQLEKTGPKRTTVKDPSTPSLDEDIGGE